MKILDSIKTQAEELEHDAQIKVRALVETIETALALHKYAIVGAFIVGIFIGTLIR